MFVPFHPQERTVGCLLNNKSNPSHISLSTANGSRDSKQCEERCQLIKGQALKSASLQVQSLLNLKTFGVN